MNPTSKVQYGNPSPSMDLSRFEFWPLMRVQKKLCFYCEQPLIFKIGNSEKRWHPRLVSRDHFVPRSLGGQLRNNYVFACYECNTRAQHNLPTREELKRFVDLYTRAKLNYRFVVIRLAQLGVTLDEGPNYLESMIS